jgi:hypothetical protein
MRASNGNGLSDDDILAAATTSATAASGRTNPGQGSILLRGGSEAERRMVEEHERLHVALNSYSAFGRLLNEVGVLFRRAPDASARDARRAQLGGLIELCHRTHEIYATTLGLWRVTPIDQACDDVLANYPAYDGYLSDAREMSSGFAERSLVAENLIHCACVAAMQIPLHHLLDADAQVAAYDYVAAHDYDLPRELRPDVRMEILLADVRLLDLSATIAAVPSDWLKPSDVASRSIMPLEMRRLHALAIRLYVQFGTLLSQHRMPVLEWDGHLAYDPSPRPKPRPRLIEADSRDLLADQEIAPAADRTITAVPFSRVSLKTNDGQRVVVLGVRTRMLAAVVSDFTGDSWQLSDFVDSQPIPNVLVVVRPVEMVIEQYSPNLQTEQLLRETARGGVMTAVRNTVPTTDGGFATVLGVLTDYWQLARLTSLRLSGGAFPPHVLASVALSCITSPAWTSHWGTPILYAADPVVLVDVPAARWLDGHRAVKKHPGFQCGAVSLPIEEGFSLDCLAFEWGGPEGGLDHRTQLVGSRTAMEAVWDDLREQQGVAFRDERTFFSSRKSLLAVTIRLAVEEPWFDGYGSSYLTDRGAPVFARCSGAFSSWLKADLRRRQREWEQAQWLLGWPGV